MPRLDSARHWAHDGVDSEQIHTAEQKRNHRVFEFAAAGEAHRGGRTTVLRLCQNPRKGIAPDRVHARCPAFALERPFSGIRKTRAIDDRGRAEALEILM